MAAMLSPSFQLGSRIKAKSGEESSSATCVVPKITAPAVGPCLAVGCSVRVQSPSLLLFLSLLVFPAPFGEAELGFLLLKRVSKGGVGDLSNKASLLQQVSRGAFISSAARCDNGCWMAALGLIFPHKGKGTCLPCTHGKAIIFPAASC